MIRDRIHHFLHDDPLMTNEDRSRFWIVLGLIVAICCLWVATATHARAAEQDGGSMYGRQGQATTAAHGARKMLAKHPRTAKLSSKNGHKLVRTSRAAPGGEVIGGRPAGCPSRFCGCALALKRFGKIVPELNLAWNWRKFPRVAARVGAIAVRPGHVMEIIGGEPGNWTIWDPNSGGGLIRIHQRSVAGYFFVDPAARLAMAGER